MCVCRLDRDLEGGKGGGREEGREGGGERERESEGGREREEEEGDGVGERKSQTKHNHHVASDRSIYGQTVTSRHCCHFRFTAGKTVGLVARDVKQSMSIVGTRWSKHPVYSVDKPSEGVEQGIRCFQ